MADTLEIFGVEYTNVAGIIAKDDNGVDQTYIKGSADFNVTLTQDSTEKWIPNRTYAEIVTAYNDGKNITFTAGSPAIRAGFDSYDEFGATITYYVDEYFSDLTDTGLNIKYYRLYGNSNIDLDSSEVYHITSNANAQPSDVVKDKVFYNADGYQVGTATGGQPNLQSKTYNVSSAGTATVTPDSGYDGLSSVAVSVPSADVGPSFVDNFITQNNARKWTVTYGADLIDAGWFGASVEHSSTFSAVPSNTTITPIESSQTIGGANYMMEGAVTVNAIPSNYVGSGITRRSSSDAELDGPEVIFPSGYYSSSHSAIVTGGTTGTPTATKGTVSNHSVSVTPSVTNTTGYITGSTKTGTAVTVSASELVSGTYTVNSSGTKDVTNYASASVPEMTLPNSASSTSSGTYKANVHPTTDGLLKYINIPTGFNNTAQYYQIESVLLDSLSATSNGTYNPADYDCAGFSSVTVNVSGGGGSTTQTDWIAVQSSMTTSTLTYTGLKGEPTSFIITIDDDLATGSPAKVAAVVFDGTNLHGQTVTNTSNAQASYDTGFTKSYSNGTLTVTATNAQFQSIEYCLAYTYGGSAGDVYTKDVQVGSGATSITFSNLEDEPIWWSCIFKSNFSTSSGYQRVMYVTKNVSNGNVFGMCLDSSGHNVAYWTATYNNGSFTITSQGTNQGGYFHQPGYYQLTYAVTGGDGNYQSKTVTPTTSQQVVEADSGYDALKRVTVNAMPSGSATAPASISGTAANVSTGTNTLTLTKTVSVTPTISAGYVSSGTAGNSSVSLTASVTTKAAATITPTTTNQTIAAGTYLTGIQTIAGDADLVGSNILSTANIFGVQGTVDFIDVYIRSAAPTSSVGSNGDIYIQE